MRKMQKEPWRAKQGKQIKTIIDQNFTVLSKNNSKSVKISRILWRRRPNSIKSDGSMPQRLKPNSSPKFLLRRGQNLKVLKNNQKGHSEMWTGGVAMHIRVMVKIIWKLYTDTSQSCELREELGTALHQIQLNSHQNRNIKTTSKKYKDLMKQCEDQSIIQI